MSEEQKQARETSDPKLHEERQDDFTGKDKQWLDKVIEKQKEKDQAGKKPDPQH